VVSKAQRAAEAIAANPNRSNRVIAEAAGVDEKTVRNFKNSTADHSAVEDRPTIDKPPRGELWDDQDDREEPLLWQSAAELV
jgi:cell division septum initiation protein DivIVA